MYIKNMLLVVCIMIISAHSAAMDMNWPIAPGDAEVFKWGFGATMNTETTKTFPPKCSMREFLMQENEQHRQRLEALRPYFGMPDHDKKTQEYLVIHRTMTENHWLFNKINEAVTNDPEQHK